MEGLKGTSVKWCQVLKASGFSFFKSDPSVCQLDLDTTACLMNYLDLTVAVFQVQHVFQSDLMNSRPKKQFLKQLNVAIFNFLNSGPV